MFSKFEMLLQRDSITAYQVSKETGIPQSTFSDWRSGRSKPGVEKLYLLAKFFNVPIEFFLEDEES